MTDEIASSSVRTPRNDVIASPDVISGRGNLILL